VKVKPAEGEGVPLAPLRNRELYVVPFPVVAQSLVGVTAGCEGREEVEGGVVEADGEEVLDRLKRISLRRDWHVVACMKEITSRPR
jgi:hypothetical protein